MAADNSKCKPGVSVEFGAIGSASIGASICGFELKIPTIPFPPKVSINLPFEFPPKIGFKFALKLTCDPKKPIDISAGLEFGGGRIACFDASPDQEAA